MFVSVAPNFCISTEKYIFKGRSGNITKFISIAHGTYIIKSKNMLRIVGYPDCDVLLCLTRALGEMRYHLINYHGIVLLSLPEDY